MIKIEIYEEVDDAVAMVDLLNHITTMVKDGYISGYHPGWKLIKEEPTIQS